MKTLLSQLAQKLAPYRRAFLHLLCFLSFPAVIIGWRYFDRLGPMGVILPSVTAIGTCLSEIDHVIDPGRPGKRSSPPRT